MATFRPNWCEISPVLTASGASSRMMVKSCLMPMMPLGSLTSSDGASRERS